MNELTLDTIIKVLRGTPIWVWAILGYLVYAGVQALKPRVVSLQRLILLPLILIVFKYRIFSQPNAWIYLVFFITGVGLGYLNVRKSEIKIFKQNKTLQIPGSALMIIIFISIFIMKYAAGYLEYSNHEAFLRFAPFDLGFSGLLSGYFSGQRFYFLYRYYNEPAIAVSPNTN